MARAGEAAQLPLIDAEVDGLLRVLATCIGATRILEIGTAIGYSGIWLAGALPAGGMLLTIERDPERARLAREYFARAGLANRVSILLGEAQRMLAKVAGPFDLIFQDGDKAFYEPALNRLVELLRPGGLLVSDMCGDGEVVPGFVDSPRRDPEDTRAIAHTMNAQHTFTADDGPIPLRDGVLISVKASREAAPRDDCGRLLRARHRRRRKRGLPELKPLLEASRWQPARCAPPPYPRTVGLLSLTVRIRLRPSTWVQWLRARRGLDDDHRGVQPQAARARGQRGT